MIVGTAGHVDHGKTALIKALTGTDTDRLQEEKIRGISIELGFAFLPLSPSLTVGFIDVPGHARFVHTMLAGASGMDAALLVVAADDGVMPQTREHLAIMNLLGVERGLIPITKTDLVSPARINEVEAEIRALVAGTTWSVAPILPVSVVTGYGMDALLASLSALAQTPSLRPADAGFRLAVDRVFTLNGVGLVVTGTILSGSVSVGTSVCVSPSGLPARVRSVHAQNRPVSEAHAGERCALNLTGEGLERGSVHRGDVILDPALHAPTTRLDARLTLLPSESKSMSQWYPVRLHHAAAEVSARVVLLENETLAPGADSDIQLVLDRPIAATTLDRFVLRDLGDQRTIGGGRIIDPHPPARHRRTVARRAQRAAQSLSDPAAALETLLQVEPYAWDLGEFARDRGLSRHAMDSLESSLSLVLLEHGGIRTALSESQWRDFCRALIEQLTAFHHDHPDLQGMGMDKLRASLRPRLSPPAFQAALETAELKTLVAREGGFARLLSHTVQLLDADETLWAAIAPQLGGESRFRPPRVRDLATALATPEPQVRRLLKLACRLGRVDEAAHDHFFLRDTITEIMGITVDVATQCPDGLFTAAQVRDRLNNGRKVTIQVLEYFDRLGFTRPRGDRRTIRSDAAALFPLSSVSVVPLQGQ